MITRSCRVQRQARKGYEERGRTAQSTFATASPQPFLWPTSIALATAFVGVYPCRPPQLHRPHRLQLDRQSRPRSSCCTPNCHRVDAVAPPMVRKDRGSCRLLRRRLHVCLRAAPAATALGTSITVGRASVRSTRAQRTFITRILMSIRACALSRATLHRQPPQHRRLHRQPRVHQ
jgi:hypothetical protein